jgi:hypothetical protein
MVTLEYRAYGKDASGNDLFYEVLAGKSTESKPTTGILPGSRFMEVDTGKTYVFDGISTPAAWNELVVATAEVTP